MKLIDKVEINYFRSLYSAEMTNIGDLNVLFGRNDSGKSNTLRALNLFFNDKIDNSDPEIRNHFDFSVNLSDARKGSDTKKFVWIKVTLNIPDRYRKTLGQKAIVKRQWNSLGQIPQEIWLVKSNLLIRQDNMTSGQKTVLTRLLNDIDFTYIPAVKDVEMFGDLIERMYGALAQSDKLKAQTGKFISSIGKQAGDLIAQLDSLFGGQPALAPPTEMKKLFRNLDFSMGDNNHSLLKQKGDGIKARHIPELLHFINQVEQRKKMFLWGFEEPENSLDLGAASSEAQRFFQFSERDDTQVFITSHSPAFYLADVDAESKHQVGRYFVTKQQGTDPSNISPSRAIIAISTLAETERAMGKAGLLQLPFIIRQVAEHDKEISQMKVEVGAAKAKAKQLSSDLQTLQVPTLYVEGKHDQVLFNAELEGLGYAGKIQVLPLDGSPDNPHALIKALMQKGGLNPKCRTLFLFDNDKAGRKACNAICNVPNPSSPLVIDSRIAAWVLPFSKEYKDFLSEWNLDDKSGFFPAEFLFPAEMAAKLYQDILNGDLSETKIQGGIWDAIKSNQTQTTEMQNAKSDTVDWFFARGVDDGNKEKFAQLAAEQKLSLEGVNKVATTVAEFLLEE
jgi:hypothetical protein